MRDHGNCPEHNKGLCKWDHDLELVKAERAKAKLAEQSQGGRKGGLRDSQEDVGQSEECGEVYGREGATHYDELA